MACLAGLASSWGPGRRANAEDARGGSKTPLLPPGGSLEERFTTQVQPFVRRYCLACHGSKKPEAQLDLGRFKGTKAVVGSLRTWELVLERLQAEEMPPEEASCHPRREERAAVIAWIRELRDQQARQDAGDPGPVLARRLSNAEFDFTIRDLTGVDMRPTREFPVDPANEAGFDNTGESLTMSPALLKKYLAAVRGIADHVVLKPEGFVFAPHSAVTDTDRDRYCVARIIDFYERHKVDLADYFLAAWKYRHRRQLGRPETELGRLANEAGLSAKYLALVWDALTGADADVGPLPVVRKMWGELPPPQGASTEAARRGCERLRNRVVRLRRQLGPGVGRLQVGGISDGSQPLVLWRNRQLASRHRSYKGDVVADGRKLAGQLQGTDAELAKRLVLEKKDAEGQRRLRRGMERFCEVFPDAFVVSDRGPYFDPKAAGQGRPLTAGFHLMHGYFRDDQPLCEWILDDAQRRELDGLWRELNFITLSPLRQYRDFIFFERAEPPRYMYAAEFDFARSEDRDATSEAKIQRLAAAYLPRARKLGASPEALEAIDTYFKTISADIRTVERAQRAAEPSHLASLVKFAERAYRRPLTGAERDDLLSFYHRLRRQEGLGHEEALRDTIASVLLSPQFCYRVDQAEGGGAARPLSDHELASRLSYFLWSSMPDDELLAHAASGDLHETKVLTAQARRMLNDDRVHGLATEFVGNWLDFRRFEEHNGVDRQRFPAFTPRLRRAMFEEPVRYFLDVARRNRSVLDLLYGNDTFVNGPLARHYGMPQPAAGAEEWAHIEDARPYGRGGLLAMAVFLTRNAPGLRTSPVKRGYWVVRRLLGEQIPPQPPTVPELPKDEAKLGELTLPQVLARHRDNKACAGCHRRFDSVGLAFEGFGPIGERREKDLGGRPVMTAATFPDGKERKGVEGLRAYLRDKRQADYVDNLCGKLLSYALGRTLRRSDQGTLDAMRRKLAADGYAFGSLVEAIVTSPQFRNKRGRDDARVR
jgi:hypothetical protein